MKILIVFCTIGLLFPIMVSSQKKAEFESDFTMTNAQGKSVKFTIGFDKNAYEKFEDTIFGEYDMKRLNPDFRFRDSFDIQLHPFNVNSYDRSIIQSLKCGEYEYGPLQLVVKVHTNMFPLTLKWNKDDFSTFCVARSYFEPSVIGPLTGNYSDIILLRNRDSLVITENMAKSVALRYRGPNDIDTIRFMNFLFRPQSTHTPESKPQIKTTIFYSKDKFTLGNVDQIRKMNIYSLEGRLLNTINFPSIKSGETIIPWIPPNRNIYIVSLVGYQYLKSFKIYCF